MVDATARLAALLVALAVLAPAAGVVAAAPPPPPAAYYGSLTVNGDPAPAGVTVVARIDGEVRGRLVTASEGAYGGPGAFDEKLQVDGADGDDGAEVTFFVGGVRAATTVAWHAGDVRRVDLAVTGDVDLPDDGGSGGGGGGGGSAGGATGSDGNATADEPAANTTTDGPRATVTVDRAANRTSVTVANATPNGTVSVDLAGEENATDADVQLDGLDVSTTTGGDFTLNVSHHTEPPPDAPTFEESPAGAVGYIQVDHSVPDEQIGTVVFRFRVSTTRLAERGLDPADVVLYRHHDGVWTALETELIGDAGTHAAFRAVSPGLSVFAVGSRPANADPTPTAASPTVTTHKPQDDASTDTPTASASDEDGENEPDVAAPATVATVGTPGSDASSPGPTVVLGLGLAVVLAALLAVRSRLGRH